MAILGRLTGTNLIVYQGHLSYAFEKAVQVGAIYMDFLKAFDKVNQDFRVHKLQADGQKVTCQNVFGVHVSVILFLIKTRQGFHCDHLLFKLII